MQKQSALLCWESIGVSCFRAVDAISEINQSNLHVCENIQMPFQILSEVTNIISHFYWLHIILRCPCYSAVIHLSTE